MTRFRSRIAIWSSLHELVRIYGSSHGSVFESPLYRVHSEHETKSPIMGPDLTKRVWTAATCNPTHERTQTYTVHIPTPHIYTCIHTRVPGQAYVRTYTYSCTLHIHILYIHTHTCKHCIYTYIYIYNYTHSHKLTHAPTTHIQHISKTLIN